MAIPNELLAKMTGRLAPGGGPVTAQDALRLWAHLFGKLVPLLGPLSNELLFARSVMACRQDFPWLPRPEPGAESVAFAGFGASLEGRVPEDIAAVNHAVLETYTSALADLIGAQLTTRLLDGAFPDDEGNKNPLEKTA
jgi:hypothetical protein